ncbi:hypothetical protein Cfor_03690 [Coptotermes formosanus]|uniref:Neurotransmitter-gated ion-channel ligand-binding domain-containing protein n=1 Tax=Coptotermes formosanus TaxID=36987 RepID=A0A6L2PD23_COPFO|nr:hypothetical protein Cfor_03690 [Coptotermes formosanus]
MTVSFRYVCGRPIILRHFSEPKIQVYPFVFAESLQGPHEKRLLHTLLDHYNVLERPVMNESDPLQLSFGLTLMQIIDVDEKNQLLITNIWLKLEWNDVNLRWNSSEYGGVKDLRIPPHRIWKPDVLMYNSADEGFDGTYPTNVVVRNNGSCLYVPPGIFKSTCKIDITWFPFDDQRCEMKFGSWTYDGFQLDLQLQDENGGDISSFITNGEWDLLGVPGKRNEIYYNCCPEPYIDITFIIIIRRRTLYYFFNLIVPCVLIASMAVLGFTLPPDSGEKLSLGVTILLSLTVFLNMVAETMPATSDAVPLLGTYFNCIMFMVASSVVSTILILNYHHRNADTHEMSPWVSSEALQSPVLDLSDIRYFVNFYLVGQEVLYFPYIKRRLRLWGSENPHTVVKRAKGIIYHDEMELWLMPRLLEGKPSLDSKHGGVSPHINNDVKTLLNWHLHELLLGRRGSTDLLI